jgi:MFS family permease
VWQTIKIKVKTNTFRAFQNRNYKLFFTGQSVSQIGTWMQRTAVSWVVYTMTHSAFMLGVTVFAMQFPSFLFSLYGGIIADRHDRHKILLITQIASMVQASLLALLMLTNHHTVWEILSLSVILGVINAFDVPARQPLVHEMINDKADLPNALALNSAMVNMARLVGPALSGIVLQKFGAPFCFLLNAVSFLAVIISLLMMKLPSFTPPTEKKKIIADLSEGFSYLKNTPAISMVLLMLTLVSLLILPYNTLLPVFAKTVFNGDAATFGYINSFIGLGAVAGTVFLASLKPGADLKMVLLVNSVVLGISMALFSHSNYFPLAMVFAVLCGFGTMAETTNCMTIIQLHTATHMRGRMMGYVGLVYFGMLPLGSLLVGYTSQRMGAPNTLLCQSALALIIAVLFSKFLTRDKLKERNNEQLEEVENGLMQKI